jgi:hypothetical protein
MLVAGRFHKFAWALFFAGLVLLIAVDRGHWAEVAQWREDQACNLWLGYVQDPLSMPVGLISSVGTPNPNGMPMLAVLLSRLPNLWAVSAVLGSIQGVLIVWVCWLITGPRALFFVIALPALSSVVLRATSVEFWNQWILTSFNLLFFGLWIAYVRKRSPLLLALAIWPMLYGPGMYLAGLVNALLYFGFAVAALVLRPPQLDGRRWIASGLVALVLVGSGLALTWIPYARAMSGEHMPVPPLTLQSGKHRLLASIQAALDFPSWNLNHWSRHTDDSFLQSSAQILTPHAAGMLRLERTMLFGQALIFTITALVSIAVWCRGRRRYPSFFAPGRSFQGWLAVASVVFVIAAHMLSPLLGGPVWVEGERPDQQVQLLPFLLFSWFLLPFVVNLPGWSRWPLRVATIVLAMSMSAVNMVGGREIVDSHLAYRGAVLSTADVPLQHQRRAVEFIAQDWMARSTQKEIPVSYQHGQEWVTGFGERLERWYPSPMTVGRAFDFELQRTYGLRNTQETVQNRSSSKARYIVTYAFAKRPRVSDGKLIHHEFGRLRVSVVQRDAAVASSPDVELSKSRPVSAAPATDNP